MNSRLPGYKPGALPTELRSDIVADFSASFFSASRGRSRKIIAQPENLDGMGITGFEPISPLQNNVHSTVELYSQKISTSSYNLYLGSSAISPRSIQNLAVFNHCVCKRRCLSKHIVFYCRSLCWLICTNAYIKELYTASLRMSRWRSARSLQFTIPHQHLFRYASLIQSPYMNCAQKHQSHPGSMAK